MKTKLALPAVLLLGVAGSLRAELHGSWTASVDDLKPGRVYLNVARKLWNHHGRTVNVADLAGLTDAQINAGTMTLVQFQLAREAGTLRFEGTFKNGDGAGQWTFRENRGYIDTVRALGVPFELKRRHSTQTEEEQLFTLALMDVSTAFIRSMQAEGFRVSLDKYVEMRIHDLTPQFNDEMKRLGYNLALQDLLSFRIHGVTGGFIRELKDLGYSDVPAKKLIQMRIHGIDTAYIRKMNAID